MFWPAQPVVILSTRAICMRCERFYEAKHPLGRHQFYCPHCLSLTGVAVHG